MYYKVGFFKDWKIGQIHVLRVAGIDCILRWKPYAYGIWVRENVELEWQSVKKNVQNTAFYLFFSREKVEKARKSLSR